MNFENEEWRNIPGYEGLYAVSNLGRVKRLTDAKTGGHKAGKIYSAKKTRSGYLMTVLCINNKIVRFMTHRLVALAFHGQPLYGKTEINHINGIKDDNRPENLEWVTRSENERHKHDTLGATGPRGEKCARSVLTEQNILDIRRLVKSGQPYTEVAKIYGVSDIQIGRIYRREQWGHVVDES